MTMPLGGRAIIAASLLLFLLAIFVGSVLVASKAQSQDASLAACESSVLADKPLFERLQQEFVGVLSDEELTYTLRGDRLLLNAAKRDIGAEMARLHNDYQLTSDENNPKLKQLRMKWLTTEVAFDRVNEFILNCMTRHGYSYEFWLAPKGYLGNKIFGGRSLKPSGDVDWDPAFISQCYVPATFETRIRNLVDRWL
jgi:hypothetical protein